MLTHVLSVRRLPLRKNAFLDLCYGTVKNAYCSSLLPPLGASDHNVVYLRPVYQRLFEREKPQIKSVKIWDSDSISTLQGCFECTDWDVFNCEDINEQVEVTSDYINFTMTQGGGTYRDKSKGKSSWTNTVIGKRLKLPWCQATPGKHGRELRQ